MLSRDEALQRIRAWRTVYENDSRFGLWAVQEKQTGRVAGCALLVPAPDPEQRYGGVVEVGWHLHPDCWGHGYAREAGAAAMQKGFADGLEEVHAFVRPDNRASVRVCEAIGLRRYRTSSDEWYRGEWLQFRAVRKRVE